MFILSEDGYVRLTFTSLQHTPLVHLLSGLDEDHPELPQSGAYACIISGYTEWVSSTFPIITIGWDWQLDVSLGQPHYVRVGSPRSNLMLQDSRRHDLGPNNTSRLLEVMIDAINWQEETDDTINARYT